jgi:hypothetical protein
MTEAGANQSYADYLKALHRDRETPSAVIAAAVHAATGSEPTTTARIVAGSVNEVYGVTTQGGDAVIVRIPEKLENLLLKERWAIGAARQAGAPVPDLLYTETLALDGRQVTIAIQRKLAGVPLDKRPALPHGDRQNMKPIVHAAGAISHGFIPCAPRASATPNRLAKAGTGPEPSASTNRTARAMPRRRPEERSRRGRGGTGGCRD